MGMTFTAIDPQKAREQLARKTRQSKHRETLQSFWDAEIPAAQLEIEADEDGKVPNKNSVASGLLNAIKAAKEAKIEWAKKIQVRNRADGVFLINRDLLPEEDTDDDEDAVEPDEDDDEAAA
jgi:hypothetical protein